MNNSVVSGFVETDIAEKIISGHTVWYTIQPSLWKPSYVCPTTLSPEIALQFMPTVWCVRHFRFTLQSFPKLLFHLYSDSYLYELPESFL